MRAVRPGGVGGTVHAPPSKSALQRAVAIAALAPGTSRLRSGPLCEDARAALRAARALGAIVEERGPVIAVKGGGVPTGEALDCGESGLALRLFAPIASLFDAECRLEARGSLKKRSAAMIEAPLRDLGARCETEGGLPPVIVRGPLRGGAVSVDARESSQFLSGLLAALPVCRESSIVSCLGLGSRPYVEMTIEMLGRFGVRVDASGDFARFVIPGGQRPVATDLEIEGDWSGAAFLLVAGAVAGAVAVGGLERESRQADARVLEALRRAGAVIRAEGGVVRAARSDLRAFSMDLHDAPDLFPPLAVLAARCEGESVLVGATRLVGKECDRRAALVEELGGLGARIRVEGDAMLVRGSPIRGGRASSRGDHRIAMAAAVAGLAAEGPVEIEGHECVSKSYPLFFEDLARLGASIA